MSEHQIVAFRAIDGPVTDENLEYMRRQSSRAEVTRWSFQNEYHYGDFGGNVHEMLRRGYDLHLHYANFGTRDLLIRLPHGLPDARAAQPYLAGDMLRFVNDKQGPGGTLCIEFAHEPGDLDELWEFDEMFDRLAPLRSEILNGDLRPLYLAHLAVACDMNHDPYEIDEGPVPAGLEQPSDAQQALMELYELGDAMIAAAAEASPPLPARHDERVEAARWLQTQSTTIKDQWLVELITDPRPDVRSVIRAEFQKSRNAPAWPTAAGRRTVAQLLKAADEIKRERERQAAERAARERAKRLAEMAANPTPTLRETERLVKERSMNAYQKIAALLADLREALAGSVQSAIAERQAEKLKKENPTLRMLVSELRRKKFLPK